MSARRWVRGGLCSLVLVAGAPAWAQPAGPSGSEVAEIRPRYLLTNAAGQAVTEEDFRGRFQLIAFGYISCPDICPTTLSEMATVLNQLGEQARHVQPIFVSLDPERDAPEVVREYSANFDRRILGLTGSPELVRGAAQRFKVRYEVVREPGAPANAYTIDHSASMYLLGPDAAFLAKFPYGTPAGDIAGRLRDILAGFTPPPAPAPGRR